MRVGLLMAMMMVMAACSSRQAYDGAQQGAQSECRQLPPAQIDACLDSNRQRYDDYQRERNESSTD